MERGDYLRVNCPGLFQDARFWAWVKEENCATWHRRESDDPPGEYSDVFVCYDHGEGSDAPDPGAPGYPDSSGMPAHAWDKIKSLCERERIPYGLLWLTNLPDDPDDLEDL